MFAHNSTMKSRRNTKLAGNLFVTRVKFRTSSKVKRSRSSGRLTLWPKISHIFETGRPFAGGYCGLLLLPSLHTKTWQDYRPVFQYNKLFCINIQKNCKSIIYCSDCTYSTGNPNLQTKLQHSTSTRRSSPKDALKACSTEGGDAASARALSTYIVVF